MNSKVHFLQFYQMLLAVAARKGKITEGRQTACSAIRVPLRQVDLHKGLVCSEPLRTATATPGTHCPCVSESRLIACLLACVSPEGGLLGVGPGALTTSGSPAQAQQVCRRHGETTANKAEGNAPAPGLALPAPGHLPGPLTQVHEDQCAQQGSLESAG